MLRFPEKHESPSFDSASEEEQVGLALSLVPSGSFLSFVRGAPARNGRGFLLG